MHNKLEHNTHSLDIRNDSTDVTSAPPQTDLRDETVTTCCLLCAFCSLARRACEQDAVCDGERPTCPDNPPAPDDTHCLWYEGAGQFANRTRLQSLQYMM
jgi:hypothetical protein